ncbi:AMP nucleosidase [Phenylobacterium montanum]|uniref:AMP nucleosidase n=1 Tax=Phenylobacterium montanum TaxID=2823693 RepID=A0A975G2V4_9CAUL|nr:AMP nucleosidase [Caulobacter sp. S6]QUD89691.1 AMP nucleosidase [Caulobacter sp. S6]
MTHEHDAIALVDRLQAEYERSVNHLREDLRAYLADRTAPDPIARAGGAYAYPALRLSYVAKGPSPRLPRAYARFSQGGTYSTTITRPDLFRSYLIEQLSLILSDFDVGAEVVRSRQEIPYPYVLDGSVDLSDGEISSADIALHFPATELASIGDEVADGFWSPQGGDDDRPLTLFDALRTDFSLARLAHYTGGPADQVQTYVLFTNYHRYVDEFVRWGAAQLADPSSPYETLRCPGGVVITKDTPDPERAAAESPWRRHQMPAYHLTAAGRRGVSLVNIGVGPSNAKTITDHLAVLRPEAWLMIGHCGGLRSTQTIGDYVLAHAYLRDDHVLDDILPPEIPVPALAEIQVALTRAAEMVTGESGDALKARLRTGTVATTDDRNWELRYSLSALRFNQSRAIAIDMESATIAAQGYRLRTPYGTLLCVSDKPLHGEIKLPGQANAFYERAISQHLRIGIAAIDLLRQEGPRLHSRKLRSFDEPPFR